MWSVDREIAFSSKIPFMMCVPYRCCNKSFEDNLTDKAANTIKKNDRIWKDK